MSENRDNPEFSPSDEMAEYLQIFLDETEEQLDDLVETLLALERTPGRTEELNEAFRLIHSIKGAAGMMGFDTIMALSHELENRFESYRSGAAAIDGATITVVLRCIDFLRGCNEQLRRGERPGAATELLDELRELPLQAASSGKDDAEIEHDEAEQDDVNQDHVHNAQTLIEAPFPSGELDLPDERIERGDEDRVTESTESEEPAIPREQAVDTEREVASAQGDSADSIPIGLPAENRPSTPTLTTPIDVVVTFQPKLQLTDLKARLILSRLAGVGRILLAQPSADELEQLDQLSTLRVLLDTERPVEEIKAAADVDGVERLEVTKVPDSGSAATADPVQPPVVEWTESDEESGGGLPPSEVGREFSSADKEVESTPSAPGDPESADVESVETSGADQPRDADDRTAPAAVPTSEKAGKTGGEDRSKAKVAETMRVDIDRLDHLMNLAGELVVNRAQFVQVSRLLGPALRKTSMVDRARDFGETLQRTIATLRSRVDGEGDWSGEIHELESGLELLREQAELWDHSRRCFDQIDEAIDRLKQVSEGLRRGVLGTRMVPIGPLFNRFKRVVRDLSTERNKKVRLQLRGEKTELDKRMIDQLGDPLIHLVRNSIDHGMESPETRRANGKPEIGSIVLEAGHRGNSVDIRIQDDGGGINVDKIRAKVIDRGWASESETRAMSDDEIIEYIWRPGFSTAGTVTDVSGRGVGMDVVKTRIMELNGHVEIQSTPGVGTTFIIRLPLTLAIVNSLLARIGDVVFSMPIDDVREIVSVSSSQVISVGGKQAFDVRNQIVPLFGIDDLFDWHAVPYDEGRADARRKRQVESRPLDVVILQANDRVLGLEVDELLGGQDVVIKSLSENFVPIRGLSGATVLGDGTVCLMLDVSALMDLAVSGPRGATMADA